MPLYRSNPTTVSDAEDMLQFQTSSEAPLFSSLFNFNFMCPNDVDNDMNNSSFVMRVETSRDISNLFTDEIFDMTNDSIQPEQLFDSTIKQQQEGEQVKRQHVFDHIDMSDLGGMEDYDMMDYGCDIQQQQEVSAILNEPSARHNQAQDNVSFRQGSPASISTASYHVLGPIHNRSGPPSLIQEEDEEKDNLSISSLSTDNLSTIFPIEVVNDDDAPRNNAKITRQMRHMISGTTTLSYKKDYTTDRLLRELIPSISQENQRQHKLTEKQRIAIIRNNMRKPSIVFDMFGRNTNLLTEKRAEGWQHQELAFFNRNRLLYDQTEKSRRYDRLHGRNISGSLSSRFTTNGIQRFSHQISSGGVSIRSNSDVQSTPETHNLVFDGDTEPNETQEDTMRWRQQQFEGLNNDDTVDYGGDDIDFNIGFDDHLLHPQRQNQEDNMQEFIEHIKHLPNPFVFNEFFQTAQEEASVVAKSFSNILELASKSQIRVSQSDPYGRIQVSIERIP
ncbi:hypothetical protein [Parasitella parasitica]|uniref:Rad21/Rec8-like protein C-terminal eukaryotic domain-containing protein n=1 Tax=Parasitella parasitica TaxID=35722 RepID=A0A0B7MN13_9FUNG|nr:hypothetical protein [Parasitella parasitica]